MNNLNKLSIVLCVMVAQSLAVQAQQLATALPPDEVGPDYKLWNASLSGAATGRLASQPGILSQLKTKRVLEIGSGMNYWDGSEWAATDQSFVPTADGFVAAKVQDQVSLQAELNCVGAVTVITRGGLNLSSTPVGIGLYDAVTGRFLVIAAATNSTGVLINSNQVLYSDFFSGGVCADIVYTLQKGSFEQDVVFKGRLDPSDFGFPTNSRIQILTEFYGSPTPNQVVRPLYVEQNLAQRQKKVSPDLMDEVLSFDEFVIGTGRAYTAPNGADINGIQAVVGKEFKTILGRTFLIETVDSPGIRQALKTLPPCGDGAPSSAMIFRAGKAREGYAFIPKANLLARKDVKPRRVPASQMAALTGRETGGVVIDYVANISGSGPTVLQGDTTYHVTSPVYYYGPVTIEGGAVIKYNIGTFISLNSSVICKTSSYRPATFTAVDDNSVGETVGSGTINSGGYANPALELDYLGVPVLSNLRFSYAQEAIRLVGGYVTGTIAHAQFIHCLKGIELANSPGGSGSGSGGTVMLTVKNALFSWVNMPLLQGSGSGSGTGNSQFYACTFDHAQTLFGITSQYILAATNCVFANNTQLSYYSVSGLIGGYNGFYSSPSFGGPAYSPNDLATPFAPAVAGGAYYLTATCGFRDIGNTSSLPADLIVDLQKRTTFAPSYVSSPISQATAWPVTAQRDNDGACDLGYHYDPLDYVVNQVSLSSTLTLANGVAVGITGGYGFNLLAGANISSVGTPKVLNHLCFYGNVQESTSGGATTALMQMNGTPNSSLNFRFTDIALGAGNVSSSLLNIPSGASASGALALRDCQIRGCNIALAPAGTLSVLAFAATNNYFERCAIGLTRSASVPLSCFYYNNLFLNDTLGINYTSSASNPGWNIQDNLFDGTPQTISGSTTYITSSNNGFTAGTANTLGGLNCKTGITAVYQSGVLGGYYYPASGGSTTLAVLIDAGHTLANLVGLYHFTVTTNLVNGFQVKEGSSQVDIGFHYAAVDAYGNPIDTDGDGAPDYLEDINGNGVADTGEPSWLLNTFNGLSQTYGLMVFTPLK